jgi:hypothetical protein
VIARLVPAAAATIVGLFGCGPAPVGRADFLRRGNAVCAATSARIAALAAPAPSTGPAPDRMAGYVDAYVAELRQEVANLRRLGYPPGERRRLTHAYDAVDATLTAVERDPLSFRASILAPAAAQLRNAGLIACWP